MFRRALRLILASCFALGACAPHEASDDAESEGSESALAEEASCRALSPLGARVAAAAKAGVSTTPLVVTQHNRVHAEPIIGGEAYARAMVDLVRSAKREVIFEVFLLEDGWLAAQLRDAIASLGRNVPVYVHVTSDRDRRVDVPTPNDRPAPMAETTAHRVLKILDPERQHNVIVGVWQLEGIVGEGINHDKAIVVDGERAIVSNINLELPSDPSRYNPEEGQTWYQMGVRVDGEVARSIAAEAKTSWSHVSFVLDSAGNAQLPRDEKTGGTTLPPQPATTLDETACTPIVTLGREMFAGDESSANAGFIAMFDGAQRNVNVITPNLNAKSALEAITRATKTSEVSIVVSKYFTEDLENLPGQGGGNSEVVEETLPALVKERGGNPCKLHVRWFASEDAPGKAVLAESEGQSHTKLATADGALTIIGSQNMDTQSWKTSRELSLAIDDASVTARFDAEFAKVWQRSVCAFECGGCN